MYLVNLNFARWSNNGKWIGEIIHGTLHTKYLTRFKITNDNVLLCVWIKDFRLGKDIWKHLCLIQDFACTSVHEVEVIILFICLYNCVAFCALFFDKINFKILDVILRKRPKTWYIPYQKCNFLFTCTELCVCYDAWTLFSIDFNCNNICKSSSIFSSRVFWKGRFTTERRLVNLSWELEFVSWLGLYKYLQLSSHYEEEWACCLPFFIEHLTLFMLPDFAWC